MDTHHFRNRDDVVIDVFMLGGGLSAMVAAEWMRIEPAGELAPLHGAVDTGIADTGRF